MLKAAPAPNANTHCTSPQGIAVFAVGALGGLNYTHTLRAYAHVSTRLLDIIVLIDRKRICFRERIYGAIFRKNVKNNKKNKKNYKKICVYENKIVILHRLSMSNITIMTTKTLKSYQQEGIRLQFIQILYDDHAEYVTIKNRRKISKSIRYSESLRTFSTEAVKLINQFQLF